MHATCRCLLMLALVFGLCVCSSGCFYYGYPAAHYVPSRRLSDVEGVQAFRCRAAKSPMVWWFHPQIEAAPLGEGSGTPEMFGVEWHSHGYIFITYNTRTSYEYFVLLHRPGYRTKIVEEWDFISDTAWEPTCCVEEDELAVDQVFYMCRELAWERRDYSFHRLSERLEEPLALDVESWNGHGEDYKQWAVGLRVDLMLFALGKYEPLLQLARRLPTEHVVMSRDTKEEPQFSSEERHREAIERLEAKVAWLQSALDEYGPGERGNGEVPH